MISLNAILVRFGGAAVPNTEDDLVVSVIVDVRQAISDKVNWVFGRWLPIELPFNHFVSNINDGNTARMGRLSHGDDFDLGVVIQVNSLENSEVVARENAFHPNHELTRCPVENHQIGRGHKHDFRGTVSEDVCDDGGVDVRIPLKRASPQFVFFCRGQKPAREVVGIKGVVKLAGFENQLGPDVSVELGRANRVVSKASCSTWEGWGAPEDLTSRKLDNERCARSFGAHGEQFLFPVAVEIPRSDHAVDTHIASGPANLIVGSLRGQSPIDCLDQLGTAVTVDVKKRQSPWVCTAAHLNTRNDGWGIHFCDAGKASISGTVPAILSPLLRDRRRGEDDEEQ